MHTNWGAGNQEGIVANRFDGSLPDLRGNYYHVLEAIYFATGGLINNYRYVPNDSSLIALDFRNLLVNNINAGNPVYLSRAEYGPSGRWDGHATVAFGHVRNQYNVDVFWVHDPLPIDIGETLIMSFNEIFHVPLGGGYSKQLSGILVR